MFPKQLNLNQLFMITKVKWTIQKMKFPFFLTKNRPYWSRLKPSNKHSLNSKNKS